MGPFHGVQSFRNGLLQCGCPRGSQALPANLLQCGLLSLHGSAGPGRSLLQHRAPHGVTASFRHPPAPVWSPFHGLQVDICSTRDCRKQPASPWSSPQAAREDSALTFQAPPPPSFTDLDVCRVVSLTLSHSSLFTAVSLPSFFFPFLCYHRGATTIADGLGLGQRRVRLRAGWHWLCQTWGKLLAASHRSHPYRPPLPKPCHTNL